MSTTYSGFPRSRSMWLLARSLSRWQTRAPRISVYGFPPALIPMYSESSGPLYCGFWKHHFAERASTIVSLSVEAGYRAREIARNVDQLFAHIVLVAIGVHDGISPEIERFAAGVGIRDLAAFDRMSMDCGE
jgi:hypothetical protein